LNHSPQEKLRKLRQTSYDKIKGGGQIGAKAVHSGMEIEPLQDSGGWQDRQEVIKYLCNQDKNKVKELFMWYTRGLDAAWGGGVDSEGEWAALSSEGEDEAPSPHLKEEEMM
jgi:hypothetical protein